MNNTLNSVNSTNSSTPEPAAASVTVVKKKKMYLKCDVENFPDKPNYSMTFANKKFN